MKRAAPSVPPSSGCIPTPGYCGRVADYYRGGFAECRDGLGPIGAKTVAAVPRIIAKGRQPQARKVAVAGCYAGLRYAKSQGG